MRSKLIQRILNRTSDENKLHSDIWVNIRLYLEANSNKSRLQKIEELIDDLNKLKVQEYEG